MANRGSSLQASEPQSAGHTSHSPPPPIKPPFNGPPAEPRFPLLNPSPSGPAVPEGASHLLSVHAVVCLRQCCEGVVEAVSHRQPPTLNTQPTQQGVGLNHCLKGGSHLVGGTVNLGLGTLSPGGGGCNGRTGEGEREKGGGGGLLREACCWERGGVATGYSYTLPYMAVPQSVVSGGMRGSLDWTRIICWCLPEVREHNTSGGAEAAG